MWFRSHKRTVAAVAGIVGTAGLAAACGDLTGTGRDTRAATLSFHAGTLASMQSNDGVAVSTDGSGAIVVTGTNGRVVDVQSVDLVLSEVTFEGRGVDANDDDDSDADSDSDHNGNATFRSGPTTVALPLEGGVITPFSGQLPFGTYDRLELDAEFARIRGTVDGQAFDVTVPIERELELRFSPPLVVNEGSQPLNATVNVDVASWFRTSDGRVIDPRTLNTDASARSAFRQRVGTSFNAFEDEDGDADDDDSDSDSEDDDR